jgi:RHS repeat-associated protein
VADDNPSYASGNAAESSSDAQSPGISPPTISLPKGGGAMRGIGEKFSTNAATGMATLTVPIATSAGRAGFDPGLALVYNSGAGNGPFGFGWQLTLASITRKTDKGLPQYQDARESDVFILSNVEDLTPVMLRAEDGTWSPDEFLRGEYYVKRYRPRVEGLFARIERWTHLSDGEIHWRSISRDNVLSVYGWDLASRIADPDDPRRVFSWLICQSYDDKGNAIVFEYAAEDNANIVQFAANEQHRARSANRYIKRIRYGNRQPLLIDPATPSFRLPHAPPPDVSKANWMFDVIFDYGENLYQEQASDADGRIYAGASMTPPPGSSWPTRQDPFSSHRATFEVRSYRLCRRVLTFHHFPVELGTADYLVRATELRYEEKPTGSFVSQIVQSGFKRQDDRRYLKCSLPPLDLDYSKSPLENPAYDEYQLKEIDAASLENLPAGLEERYRWVDLDGEGISGVLTEQAAGWFYKPNLGDGSFGPVQSVAAKPSLANLNVGQQVLLDVEGDGNLDLVELAPPTPGFYERIGEAGWLPFRAFASFPNIAWTDPNLRLFDITGDGIADVVVTEDECIHWHPSLGEQGFDAAVRVQLPHDEEQGPWLMFADPQRSIFVADLTGDGLNDIVRIRNGEVCYWPNRGYGRFGAKVTMDNAPWFDAPDLFDPRRIRLGDTDGSGTTDILYLGRDGVRVYLNQAGNSWSDARLLRQFSTMNDATSVSVVDLLGRGTACIVWSSPLPGDARNPMHYVDLMGGLKPHLLVNVRNNLGAETRVEYASSTKFYLSDKAAGNAWLTRLPFPVHVVQRIDTIDRVGRNRHVVRYSYHHGYFDGAEREFRGFGRVEELDTDELGALTLSGDFPASDNVNAASYVPPVMTKSWFHTGAPLASGCVSRQFAAEYYREDGLSDTQVAAMQLTDTLLPEGLSASEWREAFRALKGSLLRREIYALDSGSAEQRPYAVQELNYTLRQLQPRGANRHAVFFTHGRESIDADYERKLPADPRVQHKVDLTIDDFGNVLLSAAIAYGRPGGTPADPLLTAEDEELQRATHALFTVNTLSNEVSLEDAYRAPLVCEARVSELLNVAPESSQPGVANLFRPEELSSLIAQASDGAHDLPYEDVDGAGVIGAAPFCRLIEDVRRIYRTNDLAAALPLGKLQALALPFATHRLAFTIGLATQLYVSSGRLAAAALDAALIGPGGYVHSEGNGGWWAPSSLTFYSPNDGDSVAQELAYALQHFFLAQRYRDPFDHPTIVTYDAHALLTLEIRDPLGNRVTVGVRDVAGGLLQAGNDYRVLQPAQVMDANRNRSAVAFDALGNVVGTALMGKPEETLGDSLDGFDADLTDAAIQAQLANPLTAPQVLLRRATTRTITDLFAFMRSESLPAPQPSVVYTMAREMHDSALGGVGSTKVQHRFSYRDGFGREIQQKLQTGRGPITAGGPIVDPRWIGSGWIIFNNKGKPVRKYEPFFDDAQAFRFGNLVGVSPVLFYDPVNRLVATAHPHKAWEKVIFDPWRQESWDVNDTVLLDPKTDADTGAYFLRLPDAAYLPTWYAQREGGALGPDEQGSASKTAVHAGTPLVTFCDALGRNFLTVGHNRFKYASDPPGDPPTEEFHRALIVFDVEGNERRLIDAAGRTCARYDYDMLGNRVHVASMETGERWLLQDVVGKPVHAWDSRGHAFTTIYDELRRPLTRSVRGSDPARSDPRTLAGEVVFEKFEYGEGLPSDLASNLRTRLVKARDAVGIVTTDLYDFKGNGLRTVQELAQDYKGLLDWSLSPQLEPGPLVNFTSFDALDRVVTFTTADGSMASVGYDEANRLKTLDVKLRGSAATTPFVLWVDYEPKGQRSRIDYGNGTSTTCDYDPATFRLTRQRTARPAGGNGIATQLFADASTLQDLHFTYDPIGNVIKIADAALRTVFRNGEQVQPTFLYNHDAIYRLIEAGGREHVAQSAFYSPSDGNYRDNPFAGATQLTDLQALRGYSERYQYDRTDNLLRLLHRATGGGWSRTYAYAEPSQLEPAVMSNRLTNTTLQPDAAPLSVDPYSYDAHGCVTRMPHLPLMQWDFKEMLSAASRQVVNATSPPDRVPETTYFVYSAANVRARKVTERQNGTRKSERIYLLNAEEYREYDNDGVTIKREREALHVMDDRQRIALVETTTIQDGVPVAGPAPAVRYQLNNHLNSACIEVDGAGALISYEEFTPYGSSAMQGGRSAAEVSLKRYRYTGKERDEETGLSYHGARYFAPWLGRWTGCDPEGLARRRNQPAIGAAGPVAARERAGQELPRSWNLYAYARNNPLVYTDPTGRIEARTVALASLPTVGLGLTAAILGIGEQTGLIKTEGDKWVQGGESRLFDWWTIGHYLLPFLISLTTTLLLDKSRLKSEEIFAISGLATTALAFVYEVFERDLWSWIHKNTGSDSLWRRFESGLRHIPILGPWVPDVHKASEGAALEHQTNTVGDVVIGSIGAFTGSYLALASLGRRVNAGFALGFGALGVSLGFYATVGLVYGHYIPTRETHHYDNDLDQFIPGPPPVRNDRLDDRYTPFARA